MDYKARLTLDTSQHDDAIKKSAKQVGEYDSKVKQTSTDVRKLITEERKAARERAIANKHYQDMARSVGDFSKGLTSGIGVLGKFSGALAIGATAAKVVSDAFLSSESNIDAWESTILKAKTAYDTFVNTLNTGNWTNFFSNLKEAIKGSGELYELLDRFASLQSGNAPAIAIRQAELARAKRQKQEGDKYFDLDDGQGNKIRVPINDAIKTLGQQIYNLQKEAADAGKAAGFKELTENIKNYKGASEAAAREAARMFVVSGYTAAESAAKEEIAQLESKAGTKWVDDISGAGLYAKVTKKQVVAEENLTQAERDRYYALQGLTQKETKSSSAVTLYTTSVTQAAMAEGELKGTIQFAERVIKKGGDNGNKLNEEVDKLAAAIKRYRARMSALRSWSGITNMTEIEVLESSISYTSEQINAYYKKLEQLKETVGETAELSAEENKQLKQLIETQKGYRRKLSKLKVEEEERRTSNDYSGLNQRLPKLNDVVNQTYLKYINDLQNTDLFNIWENGKVHVDAKRDEAELIEKYYNEIYKYIQNIEESRKDLQYYLDDYLKSIPTKVNPGTELAKRFEEIGGDFELDKKRYEEANGTITDKVRYASNYWFEHADEYKDKLDKAILDAYLEAFKKGIDPKEFIKALDFGDITNIYDKLDTGVALGSTLKGKGVDFDYQDEKLKEFIETIKSGLDGDEEAQKFVDAFANGLRQYHIGQYIESIVGKEYKEAISKSINEQLKEIDWKKYDLSRDQIAVWQNGTDTIRNFAGAWQSFTETMEDDDASGFEKFFAMQDAINSTIDSIFSLIDGYKRLQEVEESFVTITKQQNQLSKEAALLNAAESKTKEMVTTSSSKAAIAEGTEKAVSTSSHWIEAIAAIGAVVAAITAALAMTGSFSQGGIVPKFADGGIFSGNRSVGDYNIARVNSGEMILNGSQQSKLFQLLDGTGGFTNNQPSGEVTFRIQGDTLIGVLNNYNKKRSKII